MIICTADHHHAFIANWALNRDMHVFCEKPLGITVEEVRTVRANYLKRKSKVATQHGTQRHAYPNFERLRELILDGAIGELKTVHSWDSRQLPRPGYPAAEGHAAIVPALRAVDRTVTVPSVQSAILRRIEWAELPVLEHVSRLWRGPDGRHGRPHHGPRMERNRCRRRHRRSKSIRMSATSTIPDICPVKLKASFEHPANSWRGPVTLVWYQGGLKPAPPRNYMDVSKIPNGAIFEGTKGSIVADFTTRMILPNNDDGDLTYYKRSGQGALLPLIGGTGQVTQGQRRPAAQRRQHASPASRLHCDAKRGTRTQRIPGGSVRRWKGAGCPGASEPCDRADT